MSRTIVIFSWLAATAVLVVMLSRFGAEAGNQFAQARTESIATRIEAIAAEDLRYRYHAGEADALGYVLTGENGYLSAYRLDSSSAQTIAKSLEASSRSGAASGHYDTYARVLSRFVQLDQLVALKSIGRSDEAQRGFRSSLVVSKQIRADLDDSIKQALARLEPLIARATAAYRARIKFFLADATVLTLTMALALLLTVHQLRLRRLAEARLREEASKLSRLTAIIEATPDFVGISDARGRVIFHNKAFRALLGHGENEDISEAYLHESHTPGSLEVMQNDALPTATSDGIWSGEATLQSPNGDEVPVSLVVLAHRNPDQTISHFSTIGRDIRKRKRDEAELLEKQRFVEQIATASPNILYIYDLATRVDIYCNERVYDVLGFENPGAAVTDRCLFVGMNPADKKAFESGHERLLNCDDHDVVVVEYRLRHASGDWRWMRSREMVFKRDSSGVPIQSIGVAEDITDQKMVLDEMVAERHRLGAIIEAKRQMTLADDIEAAMALACEHAQTITNAEGAAIIVRDGNDVIFKTATGSRIPQIGMRIPRRESLAGLCIENGDVVICDDADIDTRFNAQLVRKLGARSLVIVPMAFAGETLGALCVCSARPHAFNPGDVHGLSLISEFCAGRFARINEAAEKQSLLDLRTQALEHVRENEYLMRSTFDAIQEGLTVMNADGVVDLCNPAASRILDVPESALIGLKGKLAGCRWIQKDGSDFPAGEYPSHVALVTGMPVRDVVIGLERVGRDLLWLLVGAFPLLDKDRGKTLRVVTTFSDITARLASEKQLNELATTDGLTRIHNHRAFREQLSHEMSRSTRYNHSLALIMLDVDHFKNFNDNFGHPAGDVVLMQLAAILKDVARQTDFVARYGGEEFAIVLPDTHAEGAAIIAERIRTEIEKAEWANRPITASIGVASFSPDLVDASDFISRADRALYRAKAQGRNRICVSRRGQPVSIHQIVQDAA